MILSLCKTCNRLLAIVREDTWTNNSFHFDSEGMWQRHIERNYHGKNEIYKTEQFVKVPSLKKIHWKTVERRTLG
jgi:hypothetical protein